MMASYHSKAENDILPAVTFCRSALENAAANFTKPTMRQSMALAKELFDCLPYLERKGIDLTVFLSKLVLIFEAHSLAAARHILDPVHGIVGREEFISLPKVNLALEKYEAEQRSVIAAAEWALSEHSRRAVLAKQNAAIESERESFEARHGKSPVEYAKEIMAQ